MKKKILSLIVILVLLVSVSAVFGFFHNSVTGNSIFSRFFSKNIKPSAELQPGATSQIVSACYGREFKLNTGEERSTAKASEVDADFKLLGVDNDEALFKFTEETQGIDEGKNYRFDHGLEVWVKDVWENPASDGEGYAVLTFCGEKPFCSSSGYGQKFSISTGNTVYVSKDGINTAVTLTAIDANEILLNIGGESHTIDQGKHMRFTNGFETIVESAVETTDGQGIAVIEVCGANVASAVAGTKLPTIKPVTDLKPGTLSTFTSDSQRCVVLQYPKDYMSLTGNTFCASNDNRECVHIAEYRQDKRFSLWTAPDGNKVYMPTTGIRDCSDSLSGGNPPGISSIGGGPVKVKDVDRFATCCRFN